MTDFTHDFSTDIRSINERMQKIEERLNNISIPLLRLTERYSAPERPRNGSIIFADGTEWDPGSGRGIYVYNGNTDAYVQWVSLP